jgi:hypothetical protein
VLSPDAVDVAGRTVVVVIVAYKNQIGNRGFIREMPWVNVYNGAVFMREPVKAKTGVPEPVDAIYHSGCLAEWRGEGVFSL